MTIKEKIQSVHKIRESIKECEGRIAELTNKLQERKEILSKDEIFNSLNDEFMKAQDENNELIKIFTMEMDQLITDEGEINNEK
jgi:cell fate (sporulation/competence/biofilm development) regulator YmcA (YheA/YmcA/DUF963 family)